MGARLFSPSHIVAIDLADTRLEAAKQFGADVTVNNGREDPLGRHQGPDRRARRRRGDRGGRRAGHLRAGGRSWSGPAAASPTSACTASRPRCTWKSSGPGTSPSPPAWWTPTPPRPCCAWSPAGQLDAGRFVTHHFGLDEFEQAYDVFGDAAGTGALKVVLTREEEEEEWRRRMNTFVKDVMTTKVIWVEQDTPFAAIAAALREYRVSAFPVLDEAGQVIGVVSESDLLAKLALGGGEDRMPGMITGILHQHEMEKARAVTAGDLMTSPPATVSPDDTVEHAARLMYMRRVKRLPVVDADNHLAGIVSRADVLAVYDRPDVEIGEEIRTDIAVCESPADAGTVRRDGDRRRGHPDRQAANLHAGTRHRPPGPPRPGRRSRPRPPRLPAPGPGPFDVLTRFSTD